MEGGGVEGGGGSAYMITNMNLNALYHKSHIQCFYALFQEPLSRKNNQPWVAILMKRTNSVCESKHQTHYAVHKFTWFVDWPWAACSQITKFCLRAGFIRGTGLHNSGMPSWAFET